MTDIVLTAVVSDDRRLVLNLPPDAPVGPVEVVIRALEASRPLTIKELLESDVIGMWTDRTDMRDSAAYVERLRREEEERRNPWLIS